MYERIVEAGKQRRESLSDLFRYRELFYFLAWRDLIVRYKQTVLGVGWTLLRPLLTMAAFTFVFGKLARLPSDGIPYPLLVFAGLLPWQLFSTAFSQISDSIISNMSLVTKIYFPRIIIPAVPVVLAFIDFCITFLLFLFLMILYGISPGWTLVAIPIFLAITLCLALGLGLWFSSMNVQYRDIRYLVPFLLQFGMYVSPVAYTTSIVPIPLRLLYAFNPMVGIIDGFRWAVLKRPFPSWHELVISVSFAIVLFAAGFRKFRKMERSFADII
jgi:homopolymeric O-antigen transport system permease protein